MPSPTNVLQKICADKLTHVEQQKAYKNLNTLRDIIEHDKAENKNTARGFAKALHESNGPHIIAEVKKASPSKGVICENFDPVRIAKLYSANRASCLSVLTDTPYFQGDDEYLPAVRAHTPLPVLRKDFMVDPYQIYESRTLGADCILLIMAALSDDMAAELYETTLTLGMDVLIEVHDTDELTRTNSLLSKQDSSALQRSIVGVNNRNLKTLDVTLKTSLDLLPLIPPEVVKISESGIKNKEDITTLHAAGFNGFLIGESLVSQNDPGQALRTLLD